VDEKLSEIKLWEEELKDSKIRFYMNLFNAVLILLAVGIFESR